MNVSWKHIFLDKTTLLVSILFLILPSLFYCYFLISVERTEKQDSATLTVQNALYEIETLMDHINGALINLITSDLTCSQNTIKQMHELSFELLGVEAFFVLDNEGNTLCTDWLDNFSSFDVHTFQRHAGINFSNEIYLSSIKRTGVYVYRKNSRDQFVGSLVASTFFRQVLNQNIPAGDTLAFYNRYHEQPMAINGIVSARGVADIQRALRFEAEPVFVAGDQRFIIHATSGQYPDLAVAYLFVQKSASDLLRLKTTDILTVFGLSILIVIGWIHYRYEKINSYPYQLKLALKNREFVPFYQPIVDMQTGQWLGVEILARWYRAGAVVAFPDEFIAKAERYGLLKALTRQVTTKSIALIKDVVEQHPNFYFSINLAPNQMDQATVNFVMNILSQNPEVKAHNIRFEITEQGLAEVNKASFSDTVEQLSAHGIYFGLDDFGAGQSGLEYFSNLTPHFLKIDRRFVSAISHANSVDFQILKTIVQLAKTLKLTIVAEGVETEQHARWLIDQGIQKGQGWLYHKPMADAELRATLKIIKN